MGRHRPHRGPGRAHLPERRLLVRARGASARSAGLTPPIARKARPELVVLAHALLDVERAQDPLANVAGPLGDDLRRLVADADHELEPHESALGEAPFGEQAQSRGPHSAAAGARRDEIAELAGPGLLLDPERHDAAQELARLVLDREGLARAVAAALLVAREPRAREVRRRRDRKAGEALHVGVVHHALERREVALGELHQADVHGAAAYCAAEVSNSQGAICRTPDDTPKEGTMKYMILIYQGTTPLPGTPEWDA